MIPTEWKVWGTLRHCRQNVRTTRWTKQWRKQSGKSLLNISYWNYQTDHEYCVLCSVKPEKINLGLEIEYIKILLTFCILRRYIHLFNKCVKFFIFQVFLSINIYISASPCPKKKTNSKIKTNQFMLTDSQDSFKENIIHFLYNFTENRFSVLWL